MAANRYKYGARNGMSTLIGLIRAICLLYGTFSGAIIEYVTAHVEDTTQRTVLLTWLNGASAACAIIETSVLIPTET